jgi:hypothetical protein
MPVRRRLVAALALAAVPAMVAVIVVALVGDRSGLVAALASDAQLTALKTGLLFAALMVCVAFLTTRRLPDGVPEARGSPAAATA